MFQKICSGILFAGLVLAWSNYTRADCTGKYLLRDLKVQRLQVSNMSAPELLDTLAAMGYTTLRVDPKSASTGASAPPQNSLSAPPQYPGGGAGSQPAGGYGGSDGTDASDNAATGSSSGYGDSSGASGYGDSTDLSGSLPSANNYSPPPPKSPVTRKFKCTQMPVIVLPPQVPKSQLEFNATDFLGLNSGGGSSASMTGYTDAGSADSSPGVNGDISPALHTIQRPNSSDVDQLLIFYHKGQKTKVNALRRLVTQDLDVPATQIYIEGLVLEVNENALQKLGVQYSRVDLNNNRSYTIGALNAVPTSAGGTGVINFVRNSLLGESAAADQTLVQLQALVSQGNGEVLSRPSVLTLSNRQATIQIIDIVQFPIQQATITGSGQVVQSGFQFQAVRPGITLNLRPRVSADHKYVSMEIDVTVQALVPANNGEVRSNNGTVIATKPGSSSRRVETFARIPDRTPIIIGGLIASDREHVHDRVPLLGKIPILGKLFGASNDSIGKQEVIIVLTPYIVGNNGQANVSVPKDTSLFDIKNAALFQNSYRIRTEDVFDLQFLVDSPQFKKYKADAEQVKLTHPGLAAKAPFNEYLNGNIPGGAKLIDRMVYDLVRRRHFGSMIDFNHLIVLTKSKDGGTKVTQFSKLAKELDAAHGKWLYVVFPKRQQANLDQTARINLRPARKSWSQALWNTSYGSDQSAIILRNRADLKMLVDSMISAEIIHRNGGYKDLTVGEFKKGRLVAIPNFDGSRFYLVDRNVAKVFVNVKQYYRAITRDINKSYRKMSTAMSTLKTSH